MKKFAPLLLSATLVATGIGTAQADWGRHRDFRPPGNSQHHHHHRHHRREGRNWLGPAAVLAITGLAIGVTAYDNAYAQPTPVYIAPPASGGAWYYCGSSALYYPYTQFCPEGWQAVPAR